MIRDSQLSIYVCGCGRGDRTQMASWQTISDYWRENWRGVFEHVESVYDWDEIASCFGCGWTAPVVGWKNVHGWLERGHLVDHSLGGCGCAANLAPLCALCHKWMPQGFHQRDDAIDWINRQPRINPEFQMYTFMLFNGTKSKPDGRKLVNAFAKFSRDFLPLISAVKHADAELVEQFESGDMDSSDFAQALGMPAAVDALDRARRWTKSKRGGGIA